MKTTKTTKVEHSPYVAKSYKQKVIIEASVEFEYLVHSFDTTSYPDSNAYLGGMAAKLGRVINEKQYKKIEVVGEVAGAAKPIIRITLPKDA